jgi:hypothetical protein
MIFLVLLMPAILPAQNYQAIHGSSQAGGLGVANNPSSILHTPFSWDLTLFSVQEKHTTNGFYLDDYSLIHHGENAEVWGRNETSRRFVFANQDIHLLNARIRLNQQHAIAFGINLRSYIHAETSTFTFRDTATELEQIMGINRDNIPLDGNIKGSTWAEIFGTYAQTIFDNEFAVLNAGITVSVTRGLAGGYLRAGNLGFTPAVINGRTRYVLNDATLEYGYAGNIDDADEAPKGSKRSAFTRRTLSSIALSAGLEFIVPVKKISDESNSYHYDLKIGLSVLDLGFNNYNYSRNSRAFVLDGGNIPDSVLEDRFDDVNSIEDINDTLATMASSASTPTGNFRIFQPARIVLNIDKNIQGNFFVNGELTVSLTPLLGKKHLVVRDMNLIAITPRYETKTLGVYFPFTINTSGQAWIGGAVKAGPVLFGLHNWANVFAKNKIQEGGFYLAFTFRPGKKHNTSIKSPKISKELRRQLECPRF